MKQCIHLQNINAIYISLYFTTTLRSWQQLSRRRKNNTHNFCSSPTLKQWVPGIKREGAEADHSHPSSAEVRNNESITPLPDKSSWHGA
jgi:hypothetical protein